MCSRREKRGTKRVFTFCKILGKFKMLEGKLKQKIFNLIFIFAQSWEPISLEFIHTVQNLLYKMIFPVIFAPRVRLYNSNIENPTARDVAFVIPFDQCESGIYLSHKELRTRCLGLCRQKWRLSLSRDGPRKDPSTRAESVQQDAYRRRPAVHSSVTTGCQYKWGGAIQWGPMAKFEQVSSNRNQMSLGAGDRLEGYCTVRSDASWVMARVLYGPNSLVIVTGGPPMDRQTHMTVNIILPQIRWRIIITEILFIPKMWTNHKYKEKPILAWQHCQLPGYHSFGQIFSFSTKSVHQSLCNIYTTC